MRGWNLYWYRNAGDKEQKGMLTLPSRDISVVTQRDGKALPNDICFSLEKEEAKEGNMASRVMSFGEDYNTRKFRVFVSFMIKYKLYAEELQR